MDIENLIKQYPHAVDRCGVFHIDWIDDDRHAKRKESRMMDQRSENRSADLNKMGYDT